MALTVKALRLAPRILGLLVIGFVLTATLFSYLSEDLLETALLEQSKEQARIFLLGLEREIQREEKEVDGPAMAKVLEGGMHAAEHLGFAVRRLYIYDAKGSVLAHVGGFDPIEIQGHYGDVIRFDRPYMGDEVEYFSDPATGRRVPKADVIIPVHLNGIVVGGLEAEINLEKTLETVGEIDNQYERQFLTAQLLTGLLTLGLLWTVIRGSLIEPIRRLVRVTGDIAAGDLKSRMSHSTRDELGDLAESVNRMAASIEHLMQEQDRAYLQALRSLAKALEVKDRYTARHSARVANFSVMLGRRLGLAEDELTLLKQGALMHDLGKIGIPDHILNKPGVLTEGEYEIMRGHPAATAEIMQPLKHLREFAEIAAWHHERWDGKGYPDGLKGEAIPLLARIVAIADTWDAMTGDRVYRKGMTVQKALDVLAREKDSGQWDPRLIAIFIEMIRAAEETHAQVLNDAAAA